MMPEPCWTPDALEQLATIWTGSRNRRDVSEAVDELDRQLSGDPRSVGESREDDERIAFEWPLVIRFWVDPATDSVFVVSVKSLE